MILAALLIVIAGSLMGSGAFLLVAIALGAASFNPYSAAALLACGLICWAGLALHHHGHVSRSKRTTRSLTPGE